MPSTKKPPAPPDKKAKDTTPQQKGGKQGARLTAAERHEQKVTDDYLTQRFRILNDRLAHYGVKPRVRYENGQCIVERVLPPEIREFAREALVSVGIPTLVHVALTGFFDGDKVAAVNGLAKLGVPTAHALTDGAGNDLGFVVLPPLDPDPIPPAPGQQVAVIEHGVQAALPRERIERVRAALTNGKR